MLLQLQDRSDAVVAAPEASDGGIVSIIVSAALRQHVDQVECSRCMHGSYAQSGFRPLGLKQGSSNIPQILTAHASRQPIVFDRDVMLHGNKLFLMFAARLTSCCCYHFLISHIGHVRPTSSLRMRHVVLCWLSRRLDIPWLDSLIACPWPWLLYIGYTSPHPVFHYRLGSLYA